MAPWFQGRPFRISSEASAGTTVVYGVQVGLGPVVAFLVAVSLGGLLLSRSRGLREGALVVTFVTAGAWVAAFYLVGADLACFLCSDRKILWGPIVAALGASLGLLLTLFGVDWEVALAGLREELGR